MVSLVDDRRPVRGRASRRGVGRRRRPSPPGPRARASRPARQRFERRRGERPPVVFDEPTERLKLRSRSRVDSVLDRISSTAERVGTPRSRRAEHRRGRRRPHRGRRSRDLFGRPEQRDQVLPAGGAVDRELGDGDLLRRQPTLQRRIAGKVDALLDPEYGRHRQFVFLDAGCRTRAGRRACRRRSSIPLIPLTIGRPSASATRTPTWNPPESADSLPNRIRSNVPPVASSASIAARIAVAVCCGSQSAPSVGNSTACWTPSEAA